jgi:Golgi nucleoside diphosphatase
MKLDVLNKDHMKELAILCKQLTENLWAIYCPDPEDCILDSAVSYTESYDDDSVPGCLFSNELNDGNFEGN